jgi:GMP synthase (glutamine-hydrolysing)
LTPAPRSLLAIVNQRIAHLGSMEPVFRARGFEIEQAHAGVDPFARLDPTEADVVVVLGGDMGVYERDEHPFIASEVDWLRARLDAGRPTLGVCLGAQMMAEALGGEGTVRPGPVLDIGFREVRPTDAGTASPVRHFTGVPVAEWHGDTFDLPPGATLLARSDAYETEAFSVGDFGLAVQFHPELTGRMFDEWIEDGAADLDRHGIVHDDLRASSERYGARMAQACEAMVDEWVAGLPD